MNNPPTESTVQYISGPTADFGYYVNLEGGVEDTTIRPARYPLHKEDQTDSNGCVPQETRRLDLEDWLNRKFDL
jgi:hypothetical protein